MGRHPMTKTKKWSEVRAKKFTKAELAKIDAEVARDVLEMQLAELRELAGRTQVEVAAETKMAQAEISRMERRDDHLVSTLRRYVEALGGELEVVARIGDKTVRLRGV